MMRQDLRLTFGVAEPSLMLVSHFGKAQEVISMNVPTPNDNLLHNLGSTFHIGAQPFLLEIASPLQEVSATGISLAQEESVLDHRIALRSSKLSKTSQQQRNAVRPAHVLPNHPKDLVASKRALTLHAALTLRSEGRYSINFVDIAEKHQTKFCTCRFITKEVEDLNTAEEKQTLLDTLPEVSELRRPTSTATLPCGDTLLDLASIYNSVVQDSTASPKYVLILATILGTHSLVIKAPGAETLLGAVRFEGTNLTLLITSHSTLKCFLVRPSCSEECLVSFECYGVTRKDQHTKSQQDRSKPEDHGTPILTPRPTSPPEMPSPTQRPAALPFEPIGQAWLLPQAAQQQPASHVRQPPQSKAEQPATAAEDVGMQGDTDMQVDPPAPPLHQPKSDPDHIPTSTELTTQAGQQENAPTAGLESTTTFAAQLADESYAIGHFLTENKNISTARLAEDAVMTDIAAGTPLFDQDTQELEAFPAPRKDAPVPDDIHEDDLLSTPLSQQVEPNYPDHELSADHIEDPDSSQSQLGCQIDRVPATFHKDLPTSSCPLLCAFRILRFVQWTSLDASYGRDYRLLCAVAHDALQSDPELRHDILNLYMEVCPAVAEALLALPENLSPTLTALTFTTSWQTEYSTKVTSIQW